MDKSIKILSPCGILGYGFPTNSFERGIEMKPDAIIVDAGSTDAGPHKLGANVAIVSKTACKKDLKRLIIGANKLNIPLIIGSSGGSGAKAHVNWTLNIIDEIIRENNLFHIKQAVVWADIDKELIINEINNDEIEPLGENVPSLTKEILDNTTGVVAQMGVEPIIEALKTDAQIIVCGRAYDPAIFAAFGIYKGFDSALSYHLGKILECGALCCDPGTTKDCMMGELHNSYFDVFSTNENRKCSTTSVAAHTFYEKDHPYLLHGPGIIQDLSMCEFTQIDDNTVRVSGSKLENTNPYMIKLEGARKVAYRTFVIAGVRDPLLIEKIEEVEELVKESVVTQYSEIDKSKYKIGFYNYGKNGVMGDLETNTSISHELGILFEVVANTQELASAICASLRSTFMHYGYEGRKSTAGNLAFPFAPSDVEFGAVYEFSVYHLMKVNDPSILFPVEIRSTKK
ncbi:MAG: acyclic terpene utilization AtuA family protein [Spirochaetia bacterium]|nr:acyclic terpene utilization AtuA family protein [Spirochaetia bacterium]